MSDDQEEREAAYLREVLDKVSEVAGEHCTDYIFIGTVEHDDGSKQTISNWRGEFNAALGLTERMKERMRQKIIDVDFPDDPGGDDWKGGVET